MVRKSKGLSDRHHRILDFLKEFHGRNMYPPSIREIGEKTGISSTSVVNYYLDQLEKMGLIERDRKVSRGVRLTSASPIGEMFKIPVVGRIVASEPIPVPASDFNYYDAETSVDIARTLLPSREKGSELFALEVQGDSMIDAMVNDGDIVIMKRTEEAKNGDMVAIWLPDRDETTLKYYYKELDGYRLQPANPTLKPITLSRETRVEVKGKVVMVIRHVETTTT